MDTSWSKLTKEREKNASAQLDGLAEKRYAATLPVMRVEARGALRTLADTQLVEWQCVEPPVSPLAEAGGCFAHPG